MAKLMVHLKSWKNKLFLPLRNQWLWLRENAFCWIFFSAKCSCLKIFAEKILNTDFHCVKNVLQLLLVQTHICFLKSHVLRVEFWSSLKDREPTSCFIWKWTDQFILLSDGGGGREVGGSAQVDSRVAAFFEVINSWGKILQQWRVD